MVAHRLVATPLPSALPLSADTGAQARCPAIGWRSITMSWKPRIFLGETRRYVRSRGSMASRTASPKRFRPSTDKAIAQPGKMAIQGAFRMYFWES